MLVLSRRVGQWVELTHKSGDVIRIKLDRVQKDHQAGESGQAWLVFDDAEKNFGIERPGRVARPAPVPAAREAAR
jgi:hypothetical protein